MSLFQGQQLNSSVHIANQMKVDKSLRCSLIKGNNINKPNAKTKLKAYSKTNTAYDGLTEREREREQ